MIKNNKGGGFGAIFMGLASILVCFTVFMNMVDYSLYTYKRNAVSRAMDYAVTAAVQQIDRDTSSEGIAEGFTEDTGEKLLDDIEINLDMAVNTFYSVFYKNLTIDNVDINNNLMLCATSVKDGRLKYSVKAGEILIKEGFLETPMLVENMMNDAVNQYWPSVGNDRIYVNGNSKTNEIEKGTYLFAFIRDLKIKGLYSKRQISLSSFAGAKIERYPSN